jgi:hypothetical protein
MPPKGSELAWLNDMKCLAAERAASTPRPDPYPAGMLGERRRTLHATDAIQAPLEERHPHPLSRTSPGKAGAREFAVPLARSLRRRYELPRQRHDVVFGGR